MSIASGSAGPLQTVTTAVIVISFANSDSLVGRHDNVYGTTLSSETHQNSKISSSLSPKIPAARCQPPWPYWPGPPPRWSAANSMRGGTMPMKCRNWKMPHRCMYGTPSASSQLRRSGGDVECDEICRWWSGVSARELVYQSQDWVGCVFVSELVQVVIDD